MLRRGFTLVELLVSMAVMTAVAGMLVFALNGARADAKRSRAEAQIKNLTEMLLQRYEEEAERRFPAVKQQIFSGSIYSLRSAEESGRIRLMMMRDYLRCVLPDRRSDLLVPPMGLDVLLHPQATGSTLPARYFKSEIYPTTDLYPIASSRNQIRMRYLRRLEALTGVAAESGSIEDNLSIPNPGWSQEHESAECLYLILSSSEVDGIPMLEALRPSEIQDTDGDGVPEIVDPWGTPVAWMRWPVGYHLTYEARAEIGTSGIKTTMNQRYNELGDDSLDYMKSDWGFSPPVNSDWGGSGRSTNDNPFTCLPMIVSAGPDRQFDLLLYPNYLTMSDEGFQSDKGIYVNPIGSTTRVPCQDSGALALNKYKAGYGKMTWAPAGLPSGLVYHYPDPYCRNTNYGGALDFSYDYSTDVSGMFNPTAYNRLLGSYFDGNADGEDNSVDNVYSVTQ